MSVILRNAIVYNSFPGKKYTLENKQNVFSS